MSRPTIHLVASNGGHLELLTAIQPALEDADRIWLTPESERARGLRAAGEKVETIPFYGRNPIRALGNLRRALAIVMRDRPRVVLTSGAGTVVPFCLIARLFGARIVFIETMARVRNASITGRVVSKIASRVIVQWPEMRDVYRDATVCQPALIVNAVRPSMNEGTGTFIALGTHFQPFDRLLAMADRAVARGILPRPVAVQAGVSRYPAKHFEMRDYLAPEELHAQMASARYVLCHAGSGLIASALSVGRRPLVLPRLAEHGEHVDDHQLQIVEKLGQVGLVVQLGEEVTAADLAAADEPLPSHTAAAFGSTPTIEAALTAILASVAPPERPAASLASQA